MLRRDSLSFELTVFSPVPGSIRIAHEHVLQVVATCQVAGSPVTAVAFVVVITLLALLGIAREGQEAEDDQSLELHCVDCS